MNPPSWLSLVIAAVALVVSLLSYRRGGRKVAVDVEFDQAPPPDSVIAKHGIRIRVWNLGGQPVYIHHLFFHLAEGQVDIEVADQVIPVGGAPYVHTLEQELYRVVMANDWWGLRVGVESMGGRRWISPWLTKRPSFAKADPPPLWFPVARLVNWLGRW